MPHAPQILTVTLNPALDLSARCDRVAPGPKLRLEGLVAEPGGGGVNVSRAIRALGGESCALVAWGGATGAQHRALLESAGVKVIALDQPGDTRQSLTVTDAQGQQFRFVLPGPDWTADTESRAIDAITEAAAEAPPAAPVVLSGSQPPGVGADFPHRLAAALGPGRLMVDTSGAALTRLVTTPNPEAMPMVLRMDQAESETLAGGALADTEASLQMAADMVARGVAQVVVLARGAEGSILAARDMRLDCRPPPVEVRSKVGAGDSFTAGFALELARSGDLARALRHGTAAAAAAVMTDGSQLCTGEATAGILPRCSLRAHAPAAQA